jgi:histidinol-phosphate aminotransferase
MLRSDPTIKLLLLPSPGNPTSKLISPRSIHDLLSQTRTFWNGILVVDEAYIDFSPANSSLCTAVTRYPNLVVLQTLSKAFGLAGIRLGVAIAAPEVAHLLNCIKMPYNISSPASALASQCLSEEGLAVMNRNINEILKQRGLLVQSLEKLHKSRKPGVPGVGCIIGGLDANFILLQIVNGKGKPDNECAHALYIALAEAKGVVVRYRGMERGCEGSLRITVGTEKEMEILVFRLEEWQNCQVQESE